MAHESARGFILREQPLGEADRLLEILTADRGLVTAVARGARRAKSPFVASTLVFTFAEFNLFAHKGRFTVDSAELIESFADLRSDLDRLICAAHLAEVFLDLMRDALPDRELYTLWAYTCHQLQASSDPLLVVHIAQFRALAEAGFAPQLSDHPVSGALQACLSYCLTCTIDKLFAFRLEASVRDEVCQFSERYLTVIMEKSYQRLNMLHDL